MEKTALQEAKVKLENAKTALSYDPAADQTSSKEIMNRLKELHKAGILTFDQYCDIFEEFRDPAVAIRADMALVNKLTEMGIHCSQNLELVDLIIEQGRKVADEYQPS